jgi:hypothetical protein
MVQVFFLGAKAAANVGSLSIQSPESDFVVLVDGKKALPFQPFNYRLDSRQIFPCIAEENVVLHRDSS